MPGNRDAVVPPPAAQMRGHALPLVKDLHRCRRGAHVHHLAGEAIGHAVEVGVEGDVVVDVDARLRPVAEIVAARRGSGCSAGRSVLANSEARLSSRRLRKGRWLRYPSRSRMA